MSFSWSRWVGIIVKEFIQLKRDRLTFGMIIGIPVLQLILFGYAINADPKRLPTAVLTVDSSPYSRTLLSAMLPFAIAFYIAGIIITASWVAFDLPLGPGATVGYTLPSR